MAIGLCASMIRARDLTLRHFAGKTLESSLHRGGRWAGCLCVQMLGLAALDCAAAAATRGSLDELKSMNLEEFMRVEVTTVSRTESSIGQSPAAVTVISAADIRRSGATTIPELFRRVPGMDVARLDGNKWAVGSRGFNSRFQDKLLVQVDGRTVYNPLSSGVYWDAVDYPLEDIERIEIIRGPGASVWGANAVNGIINIVSRPAQDTLGGLVSAGGGTEDRGFATFRHGDKIGDTLVYRVHGKGFTRDEQFTQSGNADDGWSGYSGGMRLDWHANERDKVTFDAGYLHSVPSRRDLRPTTDTASRVTLGDRTFTNAFLNIEDETTDAGHVLARWTRTLDVSSSWTLQAYWDHFERRFENLQFDTRFDTYDVDFQHQVPWGERHKIVYGLGYRLVRTPLRDSALDNGFLLSWLQPHRESQLFSAFVQDQITVVEDRVFFTAGSKFEHNDFTGFEVQPSGRILWAPTQWQSVWGAVSRAVRTPSINEDQLRAALLPAFPAPGVTVFPRLTANRDFDSEDVLAYEVGYRAQATSALSVDLALFYNVYDKLRVLVPQMTTTAELPPGQFFLPLQWQNGMKGETHGVEVGTTWQVTEQWRLYGAYTFLNMQLHRRQGLPSSAEAAEGQSPAHQVYLQSSWNLPGHLEVDLIGRFVDQLSGFNVSNPNDPSAPNEIPDYVSLDVQLVWRPARGLELSLVGQNLLDSHHSEFGTSAVVRSPLVEIQRGIYGKVTWRF